MNGCVAGRIWTREMGDKLKKISFDAALKQNTQQRLAKNEEFKTTETIARRHVTMRNDGGHDNEVRQVGSKQETTERTAELKKMRQRMRN